MKIKLVDEICFKTLKVTESIQPKDCSILKAGINKLFQSEINSILVDLTEAQVSDPSSLSVLKTLKEEAKRMGGSIVCCGNLSELCDQKTFEEAKNDLLAKVDFTKLEEKLKENLKIFEDEKSSLETKVRESESLMSELKKLGKENSQLKRTILLLQKKINALAPESETIKTPADSSILEKEKKVMGMLHNGLKQSQLLE